MTKRTRKGESDQVRPSGDDRPLIEALRRGGLIAPETDEDAQHLLERLEGSSATLPSDLLDVNAAVGRILGDDVRLPRDAHNDPGSDTDQARSLRRAARNGTSIPPEIEEAMRRAREAEDDQ